jgi:tetratricopeptide (TPR) repeat protein
LVRLGQVLEDRCGNIDVAIEAYQEAIRLDSSARTPLRQLRSIYTARGSWETVLQIAELEAATPINADERARLLSEMGDIWQRELGDSEQAEFYYSRARDEAAQPEAPQPDPTDADTPKLRVQQAWLAAARGDSIAALESLNRALELDSADVEALDMMATVLEGVERHAEMTDFLERRAALATDHETRAAVLARLGAVREEQLGDLGGARSAYERALSADPTNVAARSALVRIYRITESWNALRTLLESQIAQGIAINPCQILCDLGTLLATHFEDQEAARSAYEEALALKPDDPHALGALKRMHESAGEFDATPQPGAMARLDSLSTSTDDARQNAPSSEQRSVRVEDVLVRKLESKIAKGDGLSPNAVSLRLRIADLRASKRDDLAGAMEVLEPVLEADDALVLAAERLAALYEQADRLPDLAQLARRVATLASDPNRRVDWYRRAAKTASSCGDGALAAESYQRLIEERPRDKEAKEALLELHRGRGDVESLSCALRLEIAKADGDREIDLHIELADLLSDTLSDPAGSLIHLRRALELDPSRTTVFDNAMHIADELGGALLRLDLLDHLSETVSDYAYRAHYMALRGDLLSDVIGWSDEGKQSWEASLELDPDQPRARERLQL